MKATELGRITFQGVTIDDARSQLAKDARTKLDYGKLAQAIATPGALLFQLRELGIQPLVKAHVDRYMRGKERTGLYSGTKTILCLIAGLVLGVSCLVFGLTLNMNDKEWLPLHYAANVALVLSCLVCLIFLIGRSIEGDWQSGTRMVTRWQTVDLSSYDGNVPEFALSKALELKAAIPAVAFTVERLVEGEDRKASVPLLDPFLVAHLGDEVAYIDVWDEKEYERTL